MQIVGKIISDFGHDVYGVYCDSLFERCVPKESRQIRPGDQEAGQRVCESCRVKAGALVAAYNLKRFRLDLVIDDGVRAEAKRAVDSHLGDPRIFTYDGVEFGVLCFHDLALAAKLLVDSALTVTAVAYLREYLRTVVATYIGMSRLFAAGTFTDVLLYGQYAANAAVICAAQRANVNWRLIGGVSNCGIDLRRLYVNNGQSHLWLTRMIADWPAWREIPIPPDLVKEIGDDIQARLRAVTVHTYSPAKTQTTDIRQRLGLDTTRRLMVAFTSSLDEYNAEWMLDRVLGEVPDAADRKPFHNQLEWLALMTRFVAGRPDLQLVIRIHPREDANARDPVRSQHLSLLEQALATVPDNVRVVWPRDPVSSYALLEAADLAQTWSSTIGLEAARMGVPVIKANRGYTSYPEGEFVLSADTPEGLVAAIDEALAWQPNFGRITGAFRFYALSRFHASVDLRDLIDQFMPQTLPAYHRPANAAQVVKAVVGNIPIWIDKLRHLNILPDPGVEGESIRAQLRRTIHFLMTGQDRAEDQPLMLASAPQQPVAIGPPTLLVDYGWCSYIWNGIIIRKYSPMCARLSVLCAQSTT